MSKAIIKIDKLKPEALKLTDRKQFGLDQYVYIKSFSYDDNNAIKVRFYVLLKLNETDFNMLDDIKYSIADGKPFLDINGHPVYKKDENGDLIEEDSDYIKRIDDKILKKELSKHINNLTELEKKVIHFRFNKSLARKPVSSANKNAIHSNLYLSFLKSNKA
jgi:hypothetical protein